MKREVDVEKVKELCIQAIVEKVSGIKFAERSEGIYNYNWAGNKRFYVEIEESIIDYSITFRAIIEGVCFFEDVITEDVEGLSGEAVASLCWTASYSRLIELLVHRSLDMLELCVSKTMTKKMIMDEIKWSSLLLEICFEMNKRKYNEEGKNELEDKAFELMFI